MMKKNISFKFAIFFLFSLMVIQTHALKNDNSTYLEAGDSVYLQAEDFWGWSPQELEDRWNENAGSTHIITAEGSIIRSVAGVTYTVTGNYDLRGNLTGYRIVGNKENAKTGYQDRTIRAGDSIYIPQGDFWGWDPQELEDRLNRNPGKSHIITANGDLIKTTAGVKYTVTGHYNLWGRLTGYTITGINNTQTNDNISSNYYNTNTTNTNQPLYTATSNYNGYTNNWQSNSWTTSNNSQYTTHSNYENWNWGNYWNYWN